MQRTTTAAETQNTQPKVPDVAPVGPQLLDPSMFKFVSGGLPRDGGWSIAESTPAATSTDTLG